MHICIVSPSFPTAKTIDFVFVDQLCRELTDIGVEVTIIAPQSPVKSLLRGIPLVRYQSELVTTKENKLTLLRPWYLSLGPKFGKNINGKSFNKAVMRACHQFKRKPDILYGHFWSSTYALLPYAKRYAIPLFAVAGEGEISLHKSLANEVIKDIQQTVNGVICVSSKSKNESISAGFAMEDQCLVIPNAINPTLFYKKDKISLRDKHDFGKNDFIIAFVGQFNNRKGVKRLSDALTSLNNDKIKAIFVGTGAERPSYKNVIYEGTVDHNLLPEYLNCADVFALPTVNEGCCNAIIEALACGLPIVSSKMDFNRDILNQDNSILVNPYNIEETARAINSLYTDKNKRYQLSEGALNTASKLTIDVRANKILSFIKSRI